MLLDHSGLLKLVGRSSDPVKEGFTPVGRELGDIEALQVGGDDNNHFGMDAVYEEHKMNEICEPPQAAGASQSLGPSENTAAPAQPAVSEAMVTVNAKEDLAARASRLAEAVREAEERMRERRKAMEQEEVYLKIQADKKARIEATALAVKLTGQRLKKRAKSMVALESESLLPDHAVEKQDENNQIAEDFQIGDHVIVNGR